MAFSIKKAPIKEPAEWVARVEEAFPEYAFKVVHWGGWCRIFIEHDGIQIGRINLEPCGYFYIFHSIKHYKRYGMDFEYRDEIFYQFEYWLSSGLLMDFKGIIDKAMKITTESIQKRAQWQNESPKRKRKRLTTWHMITLRKLIQEEFAKL